MNWVSVDFGTSYSSATVMIDNKPVKVLPIGGLYNMYGFPTVAYIDEDKNIKVCNDALPWKLQAPERFIKDFKLNIHENEVAYLGVTYVQIITEILKCIKQSAEYTIGNDAIEGVILTIPATYTEYDPRKSIMKEAAIQAGFFEIEFVKEAEAAAIYYHNVQRKQQGSITLIYDLGGGTFDPALVEHAASGYKLLGSTSGRDCGGKFFEAALWRHFKDKYSFNFSEDKTKQIQQIDGIEKLCKDIKEALSYQQKVKYPVPQMDTTIECTRLEFESLIKPLLEKTFQECSALIHSSGKKWEDVNRILLIGGSSTIPCVKVFLQQYLIGQNRSTIPIILNKSEEGLLVDTLFAVSIGGILSHYSKKEIENTGSNHGEGDSGQGNVTKQKCPRCGTPRDENWRICRCCSWDFNEESIITKVKITEYVCTKCKRTTSAYSDGKVNFCNYCGASKDNLTPVYKKL